MKYYSHVLNFPDSPPFNDPDQDVRWRYFVGEFVRPLVLPRPQLLFWCGFYGNLGKFRVFTDAYSELKRDLEALGDKLGLVDKGSEKTMTLAEDLGNSRWLASSRTDVDAEYRGRLVLHVLCAMCRLYIHQLTRAQDGTWHRELNTHEENAFGSSFESLIHLIGNVSRSPMPVAVFETAGRSTAASLYQLSQLVKRGAVVLDPHKPVRVCPVFF